MDEHGLSKETLESDDVRVSRALDDPDAFAAIVEQFQGRVLGYLVLYGGSGAGRRTGGGNVRAWRGLRTFRAGGRLSPWLHTIAVNVASSHHTAQRPTDSLDDENAPSLVSSLGNPEADAMANERARRVLAALDALPDDYRAVMVLRHISGLSYQEIAEVRRVPLGTVKTWLFGAREQLLARLGKDA